VRLLIDCSKQILDSKSWYPGAMADFRFVDICAGIGGTRIPFENRKVNKVTWSGLNGKCVFVSELDPSARKTYAQNFKRELSLEKYLAKIDTDFTKLEPWEIDDHELLLAGFPCQPFSQAGKRQGFEDERGKVFQKIADIISVKQPRVVLLENVRGLLSLVNPLSKTKVIDEIKAELERVGYYVPEPRILNARDFGLPQNRSRVFIIGIQREVAAQFNLVTSQDFDKYWPRIDPNIRESLTVGSFLDEKVPEKYTISDKLWKGHQDRKARNMANGKGFGFQLFDKSSKYVATISSRYFKDGSEVLIRQGGGKNPRKLSPREGARLQGFPENFQLDSSDMQAFRQIGNAVPVNVVRALAKALKPFLITGQEY
jgi:DNA (cytosine-5)-methyltransferase 1